MVAIGCGESAGLTEDDIGGGVTATGRRGHTERRIVTEHAVVGAVCNEEVVIGIDPDGFWIAQGGCAGSARTTAGAGARQAEHQRGGTADARKSTRTGHEGGVEFHNARLLAASDTYRLPLLSNATPVGSARECRLSPPVLGVPVSKSGCPRTRSAGASFAKEVTSFHPSTR